MNFAFVVFLWRRGAEENEGGLIEEVAILAEQAAQSRRNFFAIGDWNMTPEENPFAQLGLSVQAVQNAQGEYVPSRWSSRGDQPATRCIDCVITDSQKHLQPENLERHMSDHKLFHVKLACVASWQSTAYMKPTAKYFKPPHVTRVQWRQELETAWLNTDQIHETGKLLLHSRNDRRSSLPKI